MRKNFWSKMAVLLVSLVLLTVVSCSKKVVTMEDKSMPSANEDSYAKSGAEASFVQTKNMDSAAAADSGTSAGIVMQQDVYFEFDKATLTPDAREALAKDGEWLRINRDVAITIEGHCDERGTNEYNLALGDRRAETVKTFLADLGIQPSRLKTVSYGEEKPADPAHSESAWAKNRRAHFMIR